MGNKAHRILSRARVSKDNLKRADIISLYEGFDFEILDRKKHDLVRHKKHRHLFARLGKHRKLSEGYVDDAIHLIDKLLRLEVNNPRYQEDKNG